MNKNIDLTQILKDCPKGTKFYSSLYGELLYSCMYVSSSASKITFIKPDSVSMVDGSTPITVDYYRDGRYYPNQGECTIFPSIDQRDWSKFTAPWYNNGGVNAEKKLDKNDVHYYVARNKAGILWLFMGRPIRRTSAFVSCPYGKLITDADEFSNYGLNVRDFVNLEWEDEPLEVFINLED